MNALLDKSRVEIKLGGYGVAAAAALSDPSLLARVQEYRRGTSGRMIPLERSDIRQRVPTAEYHVSRKVDGEFTVLIYRDGEVFTLNPGGTVRVGLPWEEEAAKLLKNAQVKEAMIVGELYAHRADRRARVHDVVTLARQPQQDQDLKDLRFAAFDVLSLESKASPNFNEAWQSLQKIFGKGDRIRPVEAVTAKSSEEIEKLFEKWVVDEGAEGVVVRSDQAGMFKIKPRHNLDVVVIGFTESMDDRRGMLHDLLLAVMRHDGTLHVLSRVGGGFSEDDRRGMLSDLKDMVVESEYAEVNGDHVAYQMVQPNWIIEISCLDLISQTTRGGPINRAVLDYRSNGRDVYHVVRRLPLATVISPQFVRRREDKAADPQDIRIGQVSERVEVPLADRDARQLTLPTSQILRRSVYTKAAKGETMVRKFVLWQTNKANSEDFPSYVLHFTDFSPNRKDPLAREVRVSSSLTQMQQLWAAFVEENIKKGWDLHSDVQHETSFVAEDPVVKAEAEEAAEGSQPDVEIPVAVAAAETAEPKKKRATKKKFVESPQELAAAPLPEVEVQPEPAAKPKARRTKKDPK